MKDDQPERFMTKKNEVGFQGVFTGEEDGAADCANCQSQREQDIYVTDRIPMTTILYDYLDGAEGSENLIRDGQIKTIPDLTPGSVVPFLREQLKWRMIDLGATLLEGQVSTSRRFLFGTFADCWTSRSVGAAIWTASDHHQPRVHTSNSRQFDGCVRA